MAPRSDDETLGSEDFDNSLPTIGLSDVIIEDGPIMTLVGPQGAVDALLSGKFEEIDSYDVPAIDASTEKVADETDQVMVTVQFRKRYGLTLSEGNDGDLGSKSSH